MKQMFAAVLLGGALVLSTRAQPVQIEVVTDQRSFLPGEKLTAGVRISNFSGQPLRFGLDDEWLTFVVQRQPQHAVTRLAEVPVAGPFIARPAAHTTARFDLAPYFSLDQPGNYTVTAVVRVAELGAVFSSPPKKFDISRGTELWAQEFGVPAPPGAPPVIRKYALVQASHLGELKLYVRVTGEDGRILRVYPLSPLVGSSRPESQIDRDGNLHVVNQNGAKTVLYCVVSPDGELLKRQTYDMVAKVRLAMDLEGKLGVIGGSRRVTAADIPPSKSAEEIQEKPVDKLSTP